METLEAKGIVELYKAVEMTGFWDKNNIDPEITIINRAEKIYIIAEFDTHKGREEVTEISTNHEDVWEAMAYIHGEMLEADKNWENDPNDDLDPDEKHDEMKLNA